MNFDRPKYKDFARRQLKGRWGVPILVTIITFLVVSLFEIPDIIRIVSSEGFNQLLYGNFINFSEYLDTYNNVMNEASSTIAAWIQGFVEIILIVAGLNVYLKMSRSPEKVSLKAFFEGMNNWWRAILCYLYKAVFLFLWLLCLVIPMFIKSYAYSQMEYLIAEFQDLSIPQAMDISKRITANNKWNLFVLDLSFLGWILLCVLSCGIGFIWLRPYMRMTYVNAYHAMLKNALETGIVKPEELQNEKEL